MNHPESTTKAPVRMLGMEIDQDRFPCMANFLRIDSKEPRDYVTPFSVLMRSNEVDSLLLELLSWAAKNVRDGNSEGEYGQSMVLWRDPVRTILLSTIRADQSANGNGEAPEFAKLILTPRNFSMLGTVGAKPLTFTRFRLHAPQGLEVFDPKGYIAEPQQETLMPGDVLKILDSDHVIDFGTENGHVLLVQVIFNDFGPPLVWTFDRTTLSAVRSISPNDAATRAELLIDLFDRLKYSGSRNMLDDMLKSAHHFVRWKAVQALLRIHGAAEIDVLRDACDDEHPHVRLAAQRTLQAIMSANIVRN